MGDVRGILEITQPLEAIAVKTKQGLQGKFVMLAGLSGLGLVGIGLVVGRLRQTATELELRVIERTAELRKTNEELAIEQEKSERLLLNILPEAIYFCGGHRFDNAGLRKSRDRTDSSVARRSDFSCRCVE